MVNYKRFRGDFIDIGGFVHPLLDGERIVYCISPNGTGTETLNDASTGADYQVPTGKKAKIIFVELVQFTGTERMISSTVADSTTGEIILLQTGTSNTDLHFISTWMAADAYLTRVDAASTHTCKIFLLEVNA